mmetsp:Transcript_26330/g.77844  ORF Transcript_26330/g.77844 Transcript_26330/m.77844 type:complete len:570 (-) Transcript_26330:299-2008(-)
MARLDRSSLRRNGASMRLDAGRRAFFVALLKVSTIGRTNAFVAPVSRACRDVPFEIWTPACAAAAATTPRMASSAGSSDLPPRRLPQQPRVPKCASPERHIRLLPRSLRGDRRKFDVQTAVTSYSKTLPDGSEVTVDLHAQIHVGDRAYYGYYSDPDFTNQHDRVHFELVVGEGLLADDRNGGVGGARTLRPAADGGNPLAAPPADADMARGYGLACQVESINYARKGWVHADYTREEFTELAADRRGDGITEDDTRPVWALASSASSSSLPLPSALAEFVSALSRPLSPSVPLSSPVARRLFSNLFLPGDALAALIRSFLWLAAPSPEAFVALLDWSSLTPRPTGGISPAALPVLECLLSGNVVEARRLVFGQMVVSGQSLAENSGGRGDGVADLLLNKRNDRAMEVLRRSIEEDGCHRNALLFGGTHCRGLDSRLRSMGFAPRKTEWRTAWSVEVPKFGLGFRNNGGAVGGLSGAATAFAGTATPDGLAVALVAVPLYLALGGWDWLSTIRDVGEALESGHVVDAGLEVSLYLIRHVALYLGLSKFVIEWDGASLFGTSDGVNNGER